MTFNYLMFGLQLSISMILIGSIMLFFIIGYLQVIEKRSNKRKSKEQE